MAERQKSPPQVTGPIPEDVTGEKIKSLVAQVRELIATNTHESLEVIESLLHKLVDDNAYNKAVGKGFDFGRNGAGQRIVSKYRALAEELERVKTNPRVDADSVAVVKDADDPHGLNDALIEGLRSTLNPGDGGENPGYRKYENMLRLESKVDSVNTRVVELSEKIQSVLLVDNLLILQKRDAIRLQQISNLLQDPDSLPNSTLVGAAENDLDKMLLGLDERLKYVNAVGDIVPEITRAKAEGVDSGADVDRFYQRAQIGYTKVLSEGSSHTNGFLDELRGIAQNISNGARSEASTTPAVVTPVEKTEPEHIQVLREISEQNKNIDRLIKESGGFRLFNPDEFESKKSIAKEYDDLAKMRRSTAKRRRSLVAKDLQAEADQKLTKIDARLKEIRSQFENLKTIAENRVAFITNRIQPLLQILNEKKDSKLFATTSEDRTRRAKDIREMITRCFQDFKFGNEVDIALQKIQTELNTDAPAADPLPAPPKAGTPEPEPAEIPATVQEQQGKLQASKDAVFDQLRAIRDTTDFYKYRAFDLFSHDEKAMLDKKSEQNIVKKVNNATKEIVALMKERRTLKAEGNTHRERIDQIDDRQRELYDRLDSYKLGLVDLQQKLQNRLKLVSEGLEPLRQSMEVAINRTSADRKNAVTQKQTFLQKLLDVLEEYKAKEANGVWPDSYHSLKEQIKTFCSGLLDSAPKAPKHIEPIKTLSEVLDSIELENGASVHAELTSSLRELASLAGSSYSHVLSEEDLGSPFRLVHEHKVVLEAILEEKNSNKKSIANWGTYNNIQKTFATNLAQYEGKMKELHQGRISRGQFEDFQRRIQKQYARWNVAKDVVVAELKNLPKSPQPAKNQNSGNGKPAGSGEDNAGTVAGAVERGVGGSSDSQMRDVGKQDIEGDVEEALKGYRGEDEMIRVDQLESMLEGSKSRIGKQNSFFAQNRGETWRRYMAYRDSLSGRLFKMRRGFEVDQDKLQGDVKILDELERTLLMYKRDSEDQQVEDDGGGAALAAVSFPANVVQEGAGEPAPGGTPEKKGEKELLAKITTLDDLKTFLTVHPGEYKTSNSEDIDSDFIEGWRVRRKSGTGSFAEFDTHPELRSAVERIVLVGEYDPFFTKLVEDKVEGENTFSGEVKILIPKGLDGVAKDAKLSASILRAERGYYLLDAHPYVVLCSEAQLRAWQEGKEAPVDKRVRAYDDQTSGKLTGTPAPMPPAPGNPQPTGETLSPEQIDNNLRSILNAAKIGGWFERSGADSKTWHTMKSMPVAGFMENTRVDIGRGQRAEDVFAHAAAVYGVSVKDIKKLVTLIRLQQTSGDSDKPKPYVPYGDHTIEDYLKALIGKVHGASDTSGDLVLTQDMRVGEQSNERRGYGRRKTALAATVAAGIALAPSDTQQEFDVTQAEPLGSTFEYEAGSPQEQHMIDFLGELSRLDTVVPEKVQQLFADKALAVQQLQDASRIISGDSFQYTGVISPREQLSILEVLMESEVFHTFEKQFPDRASAVRELESYLEQQAQYVVDGEQSENVVGADTHPEETQGEINPATQEALDILRASETGEIGKQRPQTDTMTQEMPGSEYLPDPDAFTKALAVDEIQQGDTVWKILKDALSTQSSFAELTDTVGDRVGEKDIVIASLVQEVEKRADSEAVLKDAGFLPNKDGAWTLDYIVAGQDPPNFAGLFHSDFVAHVIKRVSERGVPEETIAERVKVAQEHAGDQATKESQIEIPTPTPPTEIPDISPAEALGDEGPVVAPAEPQELVGALDSVEVNVDPQLVEDSAERLMQRIESIERNTSMPEPRQRTQINTVLNNSITSLAARMQEGLSLDEDIQGVTVTPEMQQQARVALREELQGREGAGAILERLNAQIETYRQMNVNR